MPAPALIGTYPLPGMPDAWVTAGWPYAGGKLTEMFRNGPIPAVIDIETNGVGSDAYHLKCVTVADDRNAVVLNPREEGDADLIRWVVDTASALVMHKANFDAPSMALARNTGGPLLRIEHVDKITDTVLLKRLALPGDMKLKDLNALVEHYLGYSSGKITDLFKALGYKNKSQGFLQLDIDSPAYLMGAAADGIGTARLWPVIHQAAVDRQLNHPFTKVGLSRYEAEQLIAERQEHNRWTIEQQIHGLAADFDYLERYRAGVSRQRSEGEAVLRAEGIDPGNGNHLTAKLEQLGALPDDHRKTDAGRWGAAKNDLELLTHPLAVAFREVKEIDHLLGYLQKCVDMADSNGRIHPGTDVLKAAHGRDAMFDPPLHQFPELARPIVLFDTDGTSIDFSQQEPRIAMNLAGDVTPLLAYEQFGVKIYKGIGEYADVSDAIAKIAVLAGLYGRGMGAMSAQMQLPPDPWVESYVTKWGKTVEAHWGYAAAKDIMAQVFSAIPATERLMQSGKQIARDHGLTYTMSGRIVPIPWGTFKGKYSVQAHKWINYHVSGSANDELSNVIVTARRRGLGSAVRFGMHDEMLVERQAAHDVQKIMETPMERFCMLSGRRPVIRTDIKQLGKHWDKA